MEQTVCGGARPYYASEDHYRRNVNIEDVYDNRWAQQSAVRRTQDKQVQSAAEQETVPVAQTLVTADGEEAGGEVVRSNVEKYYEAVDMDVPDQRSRVQRSRLSKTAGPPQSDAKAGREWVVRQRGSRNVSRTDVPNVEPAEEHYYDNVARAHKRKRVISLYETFYYPQS